MNILILVLTLNYVICDGRLFGKNKVMNFTELAKRYGVKAEQYEVVTDDGYILTLFRLPGNRGPPVLLMHGLVSSSDDWILRGYASLPITLANSDFDVWLGNVRGNKYGRNHVTFNPDKDPEFWDFTFYEYGHYDLASTIDKVLEVTGWDILNAIGHSQGNTMFYVLGSTRPEYNDRVNVMIALGPICYLNNIPPPLSVVIKVEPQLNAVLRTKGEEELFGDNSTATKAIRVLCTRRPIVSYVPCVVGGVFRIAGFDAKEIEPEFFRYTFNYFPTGTSRKNLVHFAQVSRRRRFSNFDYGTEKNFMRYGTIFPPDFDLSEVTMPVVLLVGRNDKLATVRDAEILREQLPNVYNYTIIDYSKMNHIDFLWGKHIRDYLFPLIFEVLQEYTYWE